jgi:activator of HSP90 ATPase
VKTIEQTYIVNAPVHKVWQALVDPRLIEVWSESPADMRAEEGYKFSLWDGDFHGTNTKIVKDKLLEQDWFGGAWDEPSKVRFELLAKGSKTELRLTQTHVPDIDAADIDDGWKEYYLGPLQAMFA